MLGGWDQWSSHLLSFDPPQRKGIRPENCGSGILRPPGFIHETVNSVHTVFRLAYLPCTITVQGLREVLSCGMGAGQGVGFGFFAGKQDQPVSY
jgi:hypothetical protein